MRLGSLWPRIFHLGLRAIQIIHNIYIDSATFIRAKESKYFRKIKFFLVSSIILVHLSTILALDICTIGVIFLLLFFSLFISLFTLFVLHFYVFVLRFYVFVLHLLFTFSFYIYFFRFTFLRFTFYFSCSSILILTIFIVSQAKKTKLFSKNMNLAELFLLFSKECTLWLPVPDLGCFLIIFLPSKIKYRSTPQ